MKRRKCETVQCCQVKGHIENVQMSVRSAAGGSAEHHLCPDPVCGSKESVDKVTEDSGGLQLRR